MAKRLTDTQKWNDNWFTDLPMDMKLVWIYLLDTCDHAGVYKANIKLLKFQTGTERTEDEIKLFLKERIYISGDKWFIPKFCTFQYKNFFTNNAPAVKSARDLLVNHNIIEPNDNSFTTVNKQLDKPYVTLNEVLDKPYETAKDKDMDIDMDIDMDMVKDVDVVEVKDNEKSIIERALRSLMQTEDMIAYNKSVHIINDYGGYVKAIDIISMDDDVKQNWIKKIKNTDAILEMNFS